MSIPQLSPAELKQWLDEGRNITLLDVREDEEVQFCSLPNHLHIPMNLIPLRQNDIPDNVPIVVYCHHGMRSLYTAMYLENAGFESVYNLQGGIDAWSDQIDPTVPRY
ncbi:rhodanese-like domain-containing protein [Neisseria weaveri]|uniref:Putative thiosulfate sulfurtransferase n=1 Tax=Neisseria weaveri TaxID=28091 RepID=A0A3S4Z8G4_9NEIS|nr:rhodanese-like domain-containing protein [Neisseria weaveri]VEJ50785.1 putative thiosulfate sulfurtransferase [Neisseria weaveri]